MMGTQDSGLAPWSGFGAEAGDGWITRWSRLRMRCTCASVSSTMLDGAFLPLDSAWPAYDEDEQKGGGGVHHLRKQISRCHIATAITQDDTLGLFVKLLVNA